MSAEQAVDVDGLDASLDDLMKAADASDVKDRLMKAVRGEHPGSSGYNAVHSGRIDEDGEGGGGIAGMGDAGEIDDLMIGKMIDAGISAGTVANFVAYMTGEDEDEDEDEDDEEMYRSGGDRRGEPLFKSHSEEFSEDSDIAQAVDASPFMEALTMRTTDSLDSMHKSIYAQSVRQNDYNGKMARAVVGLGKLLKSQSGIITELQSRLGIVEKTPMPQRGVTDSRALSKSMPGESGSAAQSRLTKSEAVSALTYLNLVKGMKTIGGHKTSELACMLEAGGSVDQGTLTEVERFLATHPNEAKLAKSYQ